VPLDTSTPLDDYPAKPCGARPWMSAGGFAVSASNQDRFPALRASTRCAQPWRSLDPAAAACDLGSPQIMP
jgi:hypothetical protein